jgi:GLPGLI family protein
MKKLMLATCLMFISAVMVKAQKASAFQGMVVYDMSFEGANLPPEALAMLKGSTVTTYIKGEKRRIDTSTPMSSQSAIVDEKSKTIVTLMDVMGEKYLIKMNEADVKKETEKNPQPSIKYLDDTKEIAGYKCKKAELAVKTSEGKEETVHVFYTTEIPASDLKSAYKGLKGFPMEYTINQSGMKITMVASKVSKESIADNKFELPKEGYKETTMEEFQKSMMQMGK